MKTLFRSLLVVSALSAAACGVESELAQAEALASQAQEAVTELPNSCPSSIPAPPGALPTTGPTPLSQYSQRPLYPTGAGLRSAHTVIVTDPANPAGSWLAFGFDVRSARLVFYVSGQNSRELRLLLNKLTVDLDMLEQDAGTDKGFTWGMSGQVGGPILPQPGIYEGAWRVAWNNAYQMDVYMR
jgi:hypothetical protein